MYDDDFEYKKMSANTQATTMVALGLGILLILGTTGNVFALSESERYNVGHHEGALQASIDEPRGYYNTDCQRYDNSHTHTDSYCNGYSAGYSVNWNIFYSRHLTLSSSVQTGQTTEQSGTINCFLAICGKNSISHRSSEDQNTISNVGSR